MRAQDSRRQTLLAIDRELAEYGNQLTKLGLRRLDLIGFGKSR